MLGGICILLVRDESVIQELSKNLPIGKVRPPSGQESIPKFHPSVMNSPGCLQSKKQFHLVSGIPETAGRMGSVDNEREEQGEEDHSKSNFQSIFFKNNSKLKNWANKSFSKWYDTNMILL